MQSILAKILLSFLLLSTISTPQTNALKDGMSKDIINGATIGLLPGQVAGWAIYKALWPNVPPNQLKARLGMLAPTRYASLLFITVTATSAISGGLASVCVKNLPNRCLIQ